jgi:tRNA 2-thiocytidine biosynthesis protein TtcA
MGKHIVIRPLAYVDEADCQAFAETLQFPIIPCTLCGSQVNLQRAQMREMMEGWRKTHPGRLDNIFRSLAAVKPAFLYDTTLFDWQNLASEGEG